MKTLLLLAGKSTRFWPLSEKTLFLIAGKRVLEHQLEKLKRCELKEVILVTGTHNTETTRSLFPNAEIIEQEDPTLGTRGALLSALPSCGNEPVLVLCGNDLVEDEAIMGILSAAKQKGMAGAVLGKRMKNYFPGGYLSVKDGCAASIVEKPGKGNEPSDLVNIEIHAHNDASKLLHELQRVDNDRDDGYEQALQTIFQNVSYAVVEYEGAWQAIKFPWNLLDALPMLLKDLKPKIDRTAQIHKTAVIEGPVVIGKNVKIFPHATVRGPCIIGDDSIVGNNALVWHSSVGNNCVIGFATEVKASVLHSHVWTHSTYIGDSVIGRNVSFGAGCATGNLRLDEGEVQSVIKGEKITTGRTKMGTIIGDDCRIGIHVSINPGVKIGSRTLVAGHLMVDRDIEEGSYARFKDGALAIVKNTARIAQPEDREGYLRNVSKE